MTIYEIFPRKILWPTVKHHLTRLSCKIAIHSKKYIIRFMGVNKKSLVQKNPKTQLYIETQVPLLPYRLKYACFQKNSIQTGQVEIAELLIKAGANVDNINDNGAAISHEIIRASMYTNALMHYRVAYLYNCARLALIIFIL